MIPTTPNCWGSNSPRCFYMSFNKFSPGLFFSMMFSQQTALETRDSVSFCGRQKMYFLTSIIKTENVFFPTSLALTWWKVCELKCSNFVFQDYTNISFWREGGQVCWQSSYKIGDFLMSEILSYKTDSMWTDTTRTTSASFRETWGRKETDRYMKLMLLLCTV